MCLKKTGIEGGNRNCLHLILHLILRVSFKSCNFKKIVLWGVLFAIFTWFGCGYFRFFMKLCKNVGVSVHKNYVIHKRRLGKIVYQFTEKGRGAANMKLAPASQHNLVHVYPDICPFEFNRTLTGECSDNRIYISWEKAPLNTTGPTSE